MIPPSIQRAYKQQSNLADALLAELDGLFQSRDRKWFYTSRKKGLESFAQKVEGGQCRDFYHLEDFVGAMLVVPMLTDLPAALGFVDKFFHTAYRRPERPDKTTKSASDFPFDDIRLYGRLRPAEDLPPRPIDDIVFEIQVKTFLQHAWSISTHDLVYKHDRASWARSRVAYQVKAILEHADLSVSAIATLEESAELPAEGQPEASIQGLIDLVEREWAQDVLPRDRRRLALNLQRLIKALSLDTADELKVLLDEGRLAGGGQHPSGLSPYQCLVEYASIHRPAALRRALTKTSLRAPAIFVSDEVLTRLRLAKEDAKSALLESSS